MTWVMHWVLAYSDIIGGILGIAGSVVLGIPFMTEMADRRQWELLKRFKQQRAEVTQSNRSMTAGEIQAYREIRDRLVDERLGGYQSYRAITLWGFFLLLAAFAFMTLASCERFMSSKEEAAPRDHALSF
jgi:hypothetical protein